MEKRLLPNDLMLTEVSNMLAEGNEVIILTKGYSMLPFIIGDKDSVKLIRKDVYEVGDIVLANVSKGRWVLHRLIEVGENGVTLKGDGNLDGVEKCRMENISGCAVEIIKPSEKTVDATTPRFRKISLRWRTLPRLVRRIFLGFYRRLFI